MTPEDMIKEIEAALKLLPTPIKHDREVKEKALQHINPLLEAFTGNEDALEALDWQTLLTCPYKIIDQSREGYPLFIVVQKHSTQEISISDNPMEETIYHKKCGSIKEARYVLKKKWSEYICNEIRNALAAHKPVDNTPDFTTGTTYDIREE